MNFWPPMVVPLDKVMPRRLTSALIAVSPVTSALPAKMPPSMVTFCQASPEVYWPRDMKEDAEIASWDGIS